MHKWLYGRYMPYLNRRTENKQKFFTRGAYGIVVACTKCKWKGYRKLVIDNNLSGSVYANRDKINKQIRNLQHNKPCPKCKKAVVITRLA